MESKRPIGEESDHGAAPGHPDPAPQAPVSQDAAKSSSFQRYVAELHIPLLAVLLVLWVVMGALGFGLRPGTDKPPAVPDPRIQLYVYQQKSLNGPEIEPSRVSLDEVMIQKAPSEVEVQVDLFGAFSQRGEVTWNLLTGVSQSQPRPCPDLYHYLGTTHGNPVVIRNGRLSIDGHLATPGIMRNFEGQRITQTAANTLGLQGHSPGPVSSGTLTPLGEINLCWTNNRPVAFDGEYASASLPTVNVGAIGNSAVPFDVTRSLYFDNPTQFAQPVTAQYSLQAGSLPTSTDPLGWHWSPDRGGPIQLTALNISQSQHESYLGFLSGVLFGLAGGAFITFLQETLEPVRRRRKAHSRVTN
jgi:hypothetical protein